MTGNKLPKASIEVVEIKDYLMYFYWGRHLNDEMMDILVDKETVIHTILYDQIAILFCPVKDH